MYALTCYTQALTRLLNRESSGELYREVIVVRLWSPGVTNETPVKLVYNFVDYYLHPFNTS